MSQRSFVRVVLVCLVLAASSSGSFAQSAPTAASARPDDTPSFKVGSMIFADYTYQLSPEAKDTDGNTIHNSSFNIGRAYINFTGNLNHLISFRVTPDIARESGSGSSLSGSYTFRLKYAFGQLNLDDWTTKGSWIRLGMQQTPLIDYEETIYRYRFQGTTFTDREGFISSSDTGLSAHWNLPGNYGDVHGGFYNGETYAKAEVNNEKAFQLRASLRPLPSNGFWKGLRVTGYLHQDQPVQGAKRERAVGQVTFEHPLVNAGFDYLTAKDSSSATKPVADASGYSLWLTPRLGTSGWEMLLRHDELKPDKSIGGQKRKRDIAGVAYWFPHLNKVTSALMVDYDSLKQANFSPSRPNDTRYGLKMLISF
jgi:hypothetical protein